MEKNPGITLTVRQIDFTRNSIKVTDIYSDKYQFPYKEIVFASLSILDKETCEFYEPEITEITKEMKGDLLLYDSHGCKWRFQTDLSGKTAGVVFLELSLHAPYIVLGGQSWFEAENEDDFNEIKNMVSLMRQC
ncbi:hypothetical protein AALB47_09185 [Lachnospiraceae bacterium 54-11]